MLDSVSVRPVFTGRGATVALIETEKKLAPLQNAAALAETGTSGVHKNWPPN